MAGCYSVLATNVYVSLQQQQQQQYEKKGKIYTLVLLLMV
jgi:hypothetical protein